MADIAQGAHADLVLGPNDVFRITTTGTATIVSSYGAPAGTTTLTAESKDFGPYGVPAKIALNAVSKGASYRQLDTQSVLDVQLLAKAPVEGWRDFLSSGLRGTGINDVNGAPRSAGFWAQFAMLNANICRIGLGCSATAYGAQYTFAAGHLESLDVDIAAALALGAVVVIVMASNTNGVEDRLTAAFWDSPGAREQHALAWGVVARRYQGVDGIVFDMFNEPHHPTQVNQVGADIIRATQDRDIAEVRAHDPARVCIMEFPAHGSPQGFLYAKPAADRNVVYSVHVYQPYVITHARVDAAAYAGTYPSTTGIARELPYLRTGNPSVTTKKADAAFILEELQPVIDFQRRHGVAIFVGEFSVTRTTPHPIAPDLVKAFIDIFESLGWPWSYHTFGYPPSPWAPMELPYSNTQINVSGGQVALNAATGATNQGRTPMAVLSQAMARNSLFRTAAAKSPPNFVAIEDFELSGTGGWWTQRNGASSSATIDTQATANPKSGTKHCRITHANTADSASAGVTIQMESVTTDGVTEFFTSWWLSMTPPAATRDVKIFEANQDGGSSGCHVQIRNVTGTNSWILEAYDGVNYGGRLQALIDGFSVSTTYSKVKVAILCDTTYGRLRVWQNDVLLVDIPIKTTKLAADRIWCSTIGYTGTQRNAMTMDIDDIRYSKGADAT